MTTNGLTFKNKEELKMFIAEEVINTSEAIEILGCSRQNLNDLVNRGVLTPIKEMVRDKLFFKSDILERKKVVMARKQ
ncbi:DNA-binding protein [Cytobacillus sp. IB215665]|uniref:DNA-binding protein n=1 Tax=Cytobacillus sp. IB215665 TaxID=3097357 RepID=UPI002A0EBA9A|nr:DNA-binding protein [Cytobacillus sp. IB215665]MDX8367804.1 DNA-binding protein [Cytobacillus sp. IB215665]